MKRLYSSLVILSLAFVLHFVAIYTGIYEYEMHQGLVWFDNVLHAMVGVSFGLFWLWCLRNQPVSILFKMVSMFVFVLCMAVLWEVGEFIFFKIFSSYALGLKVYSPSLSESFFDSSSDLIGALALVAIDLFQRRQ
ncbi:hypothetical protein KW798_01640 [Candidatus Parcubacteria bacterium]|nr:hypothetical protein [Candidatus Parcubacteria bacterium]